MSAVSIREYEERLQRLAAAQPTREALDQAVAVAKGLLSTLRSWGTPPVQEQSLKQRAQSLKPVIEANTVVRAAHLVRPPTAQPQKRAMPSTFHNARAEKAAHGSPVPPPPRPTNSPLATPPGYMTTRDVLAELDRAEAWFWKALQSGRFPAVEKRQGKRLLWLRSTVLAWKEANPKVDGKKAPPIRKDPGPRPEGVLLLEEITQMCGRTQPWVYQQIRQQVEGRRPFPKPTGKWGLFSVWNEAEVQAWIAWRNASTDKTIGTKPIGQQ